MKRNIEFLSVIFCCIHTVLACQSTSQTQMTRASDPSDQVMVEQNANSAERLEYRNLEYSLPSGVESDLAQLDLFRANDEEVRPLALLVHGGSWASGDKAGFESKLVPWWIEQGYVAVPVNFRLASRMGQSPIVKPDDQVKDIAAALAWLMDHAEEYKIATDRIILFGYSSGAHLVALMGTDERYVQQVGLDETQILASISFDVHAYDVPYALSLMEGSVVERNIPIIKHLFGNTEEEQLSLSPINFVDNWAAKTLIISVDEDPEEEGTHGYIVSKAAERYQNALRNAGHEVDIFHDRMEDHSSLVGGYGDEGDAVTERVKEFLESLP